MSDQEAPHNHLAGLSPVVRLVARAGLCLAMVTLLRVPDGVAQVGGATATSLVRIDGEQVSFSYFTHFAASTAGVLAVAQQQDGMVLFFGPNGAQIGSFGRKGEGPGEFRALNELGWVGDTLWILDNRLKRVTFLSARGAFIRSNPVPTSLLPGAGLRAIGELRAPRMLAAFPDGTYLMRAVRVVEAPAGAGPAVGGVRNALLKVGQSGEVQRVIVEEPENACRLRTQTAEMIVPLCPEPIVAVAPNGNRVAILTMKVDGAKSYYSVGVIGQAGETLFSKRFPVVAEVVPKERRDTILAEMRAGDAVFRRMLGTMSVARHFPPVSRLQLAANGDVWVGLPAVTGAQRRAWHLIDSDGRDRGKLWMPRAAGPFAPESRGMWTTDVTVDGLESIVLYPKPGRR